MHQDLRTHRERWLRALRGEDVNSVESQLTQLSIDIATFTVIVRRLSEAPAPQPNPLRNPLLGRFITRGFATMAATALRRQADGSGLQSGRRAVHSLHSVLEDMRRHRALLSRANILAVEGLPYDPVLAKGEYDALHANQPEGFASVGRPSHYYSNRRHIALDRVTGSCAESRSEGDSIPEALLSAAIEELQRKCDGAKKLADKFIAHAATEASRGSDDADSLSLSLSLDEIRSAHETCCRITTFLLDDVLGWFCAGFMPSFQYDHIEHLERFVADRADLSRMRADWESYRQRLDTLEPWSPSPPQGSEHGHVGQAE